MRTYLDTDIVSYIVKGSYLEKITLIQRLIKMGVLELVTSFITEDETKAAKTVKEKITIDRNGKRFIMCSIEIIEAPIIQAPISVWGYSEWGRDLFTDRRAGEIYQEFLREIGKEPNEAKPNEIRDALHYANIIYHGIPVVISGDRTLIAIIKRLHSNIAALWFHDPNFRQQLTTIFG